MKRALIVLCFLAIGGCRASRGEVVQAPPAPTQPPEVTRALEAMDALLRSLQSRLQQALAERGVAGAVEVCREEAPALAAKIAAERGLELGRTSHKLRNPANAPRPWVSPYLRAAAGKPASGVPQTVVDLGDRIGVLRPIPTGGACLLCHGDPQGFDPELRRTLDRLYPNDKAVGFREGEFRGFVWAEVQKSRP